MQLALSFSSLLLTGILLAGISHAAPPPSSPLVKALKDARKQQCSAPMYAHGDDSTPETRWKESHADELLDALMAEWAVAGHQDHPSLSHFIASVFGDQEEDWNCGNIDVSNACHTYSYKCNPSVGPAGAMILQSFTNIQTYFSTIRTNIEFGEASESTSDETVAEKDVQYKQPPVDIGLIIGFLADLVIPGIGSMIGRVGEQTFARSLKSFSKKEPPSYADSQAFEAAKKRGLDYQLMGNNIAFEMSVTATEILAQGKNLQEGAMSMINEITDLQEFSAKIVNNWEDTTQRYLSDVFAGTTKSDHMAKNGISNYATLKSMLSNGKFLTLTNLDLNANDIKQASKTALFSQLLPLSLYQNDDVRPVLMVRPYACDNMTEAGYDVGFRELFTPTNGWESIWKSTAVTVPEHEGLCFFFLNADKSGAGTMMGGFLDVIDGFTHSAFQSTDFGDLTLADMAGSIFNWYQKNGNDKDKKFKASMNLADDSAESLFDYPFSAPGMYNAYFNVCGMMTPGADMSVKKNPDIAIIRGNLAQAADWSFADMKKGYPCRPIPSSEWYWYEGGP